MAGLIPVRKAAACHCEARFNVPGSSHIAVEPYQFSCIHRMASSSLNCLSNSYSCRASTDMLAGGGWGAGSVRTKRVSAAEMSLFSRFPCRFELASLGSLSDPVGSSRLAEPSSSAGRAYALFIRRVDSGS